MERDDFLDRIRGRLADELSAVADPSGAHQWVISEDDDNGLATADVTGTDRADHELLASLVGTGAFAAAFVNHLPGPPEQLYVQVLVTRPFRDSDVRQAALQRDASGHAQLGEWQYVVP